MSSYQFRRQTFTLLDEQFSLYVFDQFEKTLDLFLDSLAGQQELDLTNDKVPLYGQVWPSSLALSEFLMEQQQGKLSGTRVLEVGCGLALPSLVAARMGAHVVATDYLAEIGALLQQNIALNGSCDIVYELCDYRTPPYPTWSSFDFILASEVTYEQCYFAPLIAFLKQVAGPATTIYLADPLRTHHAALISCIEESGQFAVSHYDRLMGPPEQQAVCRILCLRKKEGL